MAATIVFATHLAVIAFNVAGCVLIPLGGWRGWRWVREFWWRLVHLLSFAVVALQATLGRACFLTIWQEDISGAPHAQPLIAGWIDRLVYWPLPLWVFALIYVATFVYVVALWVWVRPAVPGSNRRR